jgi:ATP-binding cassette subfamily B protein
MHRLLRLLSAVGRGRLRRSALIELMLPLIGRHRRRLTVVVLMMPIAAAMAMLVPYLTKVAIDSYIVPAIGDGALQTVLTPLLILTAISIVVVILGYLADAVYVTLLQRIGQSLIAELRDIVYRRTLRLPRRYFDDTPIGAILTRVTSDMEALGEGLATGVLGLFMDSLKTLAYLAMMFALNWRLTLVLLLIAPVLVVLINFFQRRVRRTFFRARQSLSEATGYLQEVLNGMKTVQLYGAELQVIERYRKKNHAYYQAQNASNFYDAMLFSLVEGITTLSLALLLWYAAGELLAGLLTLGVLVAFMEYTQRLFIPVREFAQQLAVLQRAMAALDHINQLVEVPLDPAEEQSTSADDDGRPRHQPFESLVFEQVRFRYRDKSEDILKGISFSIRAGQTLAIVGPSGSGKSTIIRLLIRAYGGYQGSIRINGEELRDISAQRLSRLMAVVHQSVFLYKDTLAFNIALGRPGVDAERVREVARYVNADRFIDKLSQGYATPIAPGGANLSAGEAQLIALARAVAEETDLIILDEATSSVDSLTESLIQKAVGRLYQDKTVIAIAHRLSTIRSADTILVLDAGSVVESGHHSELLANNGLYAELIGKLEASTRRTTAPGLLP